MRLHTLGWNASVEARSSLTFNYEFGEQVMVVNARADSVRAIVARLAYGLKGQGRFSASRHPECDQFWHSAKFCDNSACVPCSLCFLG